jgi:peroxiredoxin
MVKLKEDDKTWQGNLNTAKHINEAQSLLKAGKAKEAAAIIEQVNVPRWSSSKGFVLSLKSSILDAAGKTDQAYKGLLDAFVKEPTGEMHGQLVKFGTRLGKDVKKINDDIWYIRDTASKVAPNFTMETYLTKGKVSLSDYKGKVVLITYWFPGCGPCRGEFPHFENVVRKFKGKDFAYLGINIVEEQDEYVVPFMKSSGYSFTPIKDHKDWEKGPLNNRNAAPVNFLIDQDGRIIFSNFRTDGHNEETLELMIKSLLERNKHA